MSAVIYVRSTSQKTDTNTTTADWLAANQIQHTVNTLNKDTLSISNAASENNITKMLDACENLSTSTQSAKNIPAGPDKELTLQLTNAITTLSNSAEQCVRAINSNDSALLESSAREATSGLRQLNNFADKVKTISD